MSRFEKLIIRIRSLDKNIRFQELKKILEYYGYHMSGPSGGSSHMTFRKVGCNPITIPKKEPIKLKYVQMVRNVVESEERDDENN